MMANLGVKCLQILKNGQVKALVTARHLSDNGLHAVKKRGGKNHYFESVSQRLGPSSSNTSIAEPPMYVRAHLDFLLQQKPFFMNVANTKKGQNEIDDESYDGSVRFYGFRGCRDKHGVKLKHLELKIREEMERTFIDEPRMRSGHFALSADDGNTAYGFNPIVPHGMPIKDAFKLAFENETFAGQISDDTEVFQHAKCFENHGWNTEVAEIRLAVPKWFQTSVQKVLTGLSQIEDGSHGYKYTYPYRTQNGNGHYFTDPATTGNCATFFSTCLGIDVPGITTGNGSMRCIMPLMETIDSTLVLSNIGQETYSNNKQSQH